MEHFKEIIQNITSKILISSSDSDDEKALKITWYAFFGSLILIIVVAWILFLIITFNNNTVKIPSLEQQTIYTALNKLAEKKLVGSVVPEYNDSIPEGIVFKQNPKQGEMTKEGRQVVMSVSLGPKRESLPDFRGYSLFELQEFLQNQYPEMDIPFDLETPVFEFSSDVEKGRIIRQDPADGTPIYGIQKVKLWVSNGPSDPSAILLDNYVGMTLEEASSLLASKEIFYSYDLELTSNKNDAMRVVAQSHPEGTPVSTLIEEKKVVVLKVLTYQRIDGDKIVGIYLLDLPEKPLAYNVKVTQVLPNGKEKKVLTRTLKGGVSIPVYYTAKAGNLLRIYYDDKVTKEIELTIPDEE